ncbi:hypothetical protein GCM10023094_34500 [Rhodococcus olei]|uniref:Phosphatidic acid phosphatase type 2/haloperoxidase domain-containing protein n=1 Tax=Rhodococcus olei TaxID=2161675 RepID=A0ABP8PAX5_9NOCA
MSDILDMVHGLVTEIRTESATSEVALWTVSITVAVYAGALLAERWFRRRREGTVGWVAARFTALVVMFTLLTVQVHSSGWLTGADTTTLDWFVAHRHPAATSAVMVIADATSPVGVGVAAVAAAALAGWRRRSLIPAVLIVGMVAVAETAGAAVKVIVGRSRPPVATQAVTEAGWSFPSGHVTGIVALTGALLVVLGTQVRTAAGRALAGAAAVFAVSVVAATRLYLGVHWLTDVIGGALLAGAVVTAGSLVAAALAARRRTIVDPAPLPPPEQIPPVDHRTVRNSAPRHDYVDPPRPPVETR